MNFMKNLFCLPSSLLIVFSLSAQDIVSVDAFKKLSDKQRLEMIAQAPLEQQPELKKIDLHLAVLSQYGSEESLKTAKESCAIKNRGFGDIEELFLSYRTVWDSYLAGVMINNEGSGMTRQMQHEAMDNIEKDKTVALQRFSSAHSMILKIAPTPNATALEMEAAVLRKKLVKRLVSTSLDKLEPLIEKEEKDTLEQQLSKIYEKLKTLPTLPAQQVEEEINAIPEQRLYMHTLF